MIVEEIQNNPDTLIEMEEGELKFDSGMKNNSKVLFLPSFNLLKVFFIGKKKPLFFCP